MNKLTQALDLAAQGFYIFPLTEKSKIPAVKNWPVKATRNADHIKRWWDNRPDCNIGIFTGRYGEDQALLVVDVDNKKDKHGSDELLKLDLEGYDIGEPDMVVETPTGGQHLIFIVDEAVKQGVDVLGTGLDIRSRGGYIVGPGSEL